MVIINTHTQIHTHTHKKKKTHDNIIITNEIIYNMGNMVGKYCPKTLLVHINAFPTGTTVI